MCQGTAYLRVEPSPIPMGWITGLPRAPAQFHMYRQSQAVWWSWEGPFRMAASSRPLEATIDKHPLRITAIKGKSYNIHTSKTPMFTHALGHFAWIGMQDLLFTPKVHDKTFFWMFFRIIVESSFLIGGNRHWLNRQTYLIEYWYGCSKKCQLDSQIKSLIDMSWPEPNTKFWKCRVHWTLSV